MNAEEKEKGDTTIKSHRYWIASIIILTIAILGILYLFFFSSYRKHIDSNVFVVSLTALFGLLGTAFQIKASKERDAEKRLHEIR